MSHEEDHSILLTAEDCAKMLIGMFPDKLPQSALNAAIDTNPHRLGDISPLGFRCSPQQMFNDAILAALKDIATTK